MKRIAGAALGAALAAAAFAAVADDARVPAGPCAVVAALPCARDVGRGLSGPFLPAGRRLTYASGRPESGVAARIDALGLTVSEITAALASRYRISQSVSGVVVTEVGRAGRGIEVGDVIVELDQDPIAGPADLALRLAAHAAEPRSALVLVYRDYEHRFIVLAGD